MIRVWPVLLVAAAGAAACTGPPATIDGRVLARGAGASGITVEAWLQAERRPGSTPFTSVETDAAGGFTMTLPSGTYWLMARDLGASVGPRRIAEFPGNPVRLVPGSRVRLPDLALHGAGLTETDGGSGIRGRARLEGAAAADAVVTAYPADRARLSGPGYVALVRTDAEGVFRIDLPPGAYRLAVRLRGGGASAGRLRLGDASAELDGLLLVRPGRILEAGEILLHRVDPARLVAEEARGFQGAADTALEGRVVDREGKPRRGIFVFVYRDAGMIGRPEAVAETGPGGEFLLSLPGAGRYYVGARSARGGPRQPGEWSGTFAGEGDGGLEVAAGRRVRGLTVIVAQEW